MIAELMARWCATPCSLLFILFGWVGLSGSTLRSEESVELLHLFESRGKIACGNGPISKCLNHLELLNEEEIKRVHFGSVSVVLPESRMPLLGGVKVVLPVRYGSFQSEFSQMPQVGGISVDLVPLGISDALPPSIEDDRDGADGSTTKNASTSSDYGNALYVFLFLWGHEWWVLALWWGLMIFVILVHVDWIYGIIYEWKISSTNVKVSARPREKASTKDGGLEP